MSAPDVKTWSRDSKSHRLSSSEVQNLMTNTKSDDEMDAAKRVMSALVRTPPKPHEDMKLGKGKPRDRKKRVANPKPASRKD